MNRPSWLGGHGRWERSLHAYLDGSLRGDGRAAFVRHMGSCELCRSVAGELDAIRTVLRAAPDVPAPRSFAITPEMAAAARAQGPGAAEPSPVVDRVPVRPPAPVFALRFARVAAGVAALAFAAVLVADLGGVGSGDSSMGATADQFATQSLETGDDLAGGEPAIAPETTGQRSGPDIDEGANATAIAPLPTVGEDVEGAGASIPTPGATPEPPSTGNSSRYDTGNDGSSAQDDRPSIAAIPADADSASIQLAAHDDDSADSTKMVLRSFEAVFAAVAVGAGVLAFFASRSVRSRRESA